MTVTVSGKLVVIYTTDEDVEKEVEITSEDIEVGEPEIHDGDRGMGPEVVYVASASSDLLGDIEWQIYEYPAGVLNQVVEPNLDGTVIQQPVFSIQLD